MPKPCVFVWLAREGNSAEQNAAYDTLFSDVPLPEDRSMVISGEEDELVPVEDTITGLPLADRFEDSAIAAAKSKGMDQVTFVSAVYFRDRSDAPDSSGDRSPVSFIGIFDFPFPERGERIPRSEHDWLGIDEAYCSDDGENFEDDDYIGHY